MTLPPHDSSIVFGLLADRISVAVHKQKILTSPMKQVSALHEITNK